MQDHQLTLQMVLERMRDGERRQRGGDAHRRRAGACLLREVGERADKLAAALTKLGVEPEDRVATFMWNSQQHLEVYLAAPNMGAVLHTLNIRLFPEQLTYIVNHARDKVIVVDDSLIPLLAPLVDQFEHVEHFIVDRRRRRERAAERAALRGAAGGRGRRASTSPSSTSAQAAGLCYTSGTTGNPKGVLYSHRSNILHCIATCMADTVGITVVGPRAARGADVPRERVGLPLRLRARRRRPRDARPLPPGRAAGEA